MKLSLKAYGILLVVAIAAVSMIPLALVASKANSSIVSKVTEQMYLNTLDGALNVLKEYVKTEYGTLRLVNNTLVDKDGKPIRDRFEVVDKISQQMNIVATIFQREGDDFLRVSTSIRKDDGSRAIGTFLGKDSAAYKPLMQKQRYVGSAKILGKDYATAYEPVLDEYGNIIGVLFVGVPKAKINEIVANNNRTFLRDILIEAIIVLAVVMVIGYMFVNVVLIKAMNRFSEIMNRIKDGDLAFKIEYKFNSKEFSQLAETVEQMKRGLADLVLNISKVSNTVSEKSQNLASVSEELSASSEELASQMEEVNRSAQNASASIEEVNSGIEEVA
ncbi:Cache 3/Cache 2 fusion domain-containing protein, partial [Thermotoga sp. Ku-13t]|uniref:Cache 3/Cache 2 fusion domain-containing protein n=1 Tax=Thermotoga sp. Ku-13t TaxID=1755813 RepID=UPI0013ED56C6